jgi:hypothetical protein
LSEAVHCSTAPTPENSPGTSTSIHLCIDCLELVNAVAAKQAVVAGQKWVPNHPKCGNHAKCCMLIPPCQIPVLMVYANHAKRMLPADSSAPESSDLGGADEGEVQGVEEQDQILACEYVTSADGFAFDETGVVVWVRFSHVLSASRDLPLKSSMEMSLICRYSNEGNGWAYTLIS